MAEIELINISKIYGSPKHKGLLPVGKKAVDDVTLKIKDRSFTVLVGPSGCGKTTLLRMIAGLEDITLGTLKIGGINVTDVEPGDRGLAMVFQTYALYPHMTVWGNIEFGLKNARIPRYEIDARIREVLKLVNLEEYANRKPANLSGGQRQRVALARAIAKKPEVFLMDEPLSNLDAKLRSTMRTELIQMHEKLNSTFLYVTHDQIEAMTMGDTIVVMNEGVVMQAGTPNEIHDDPNCVFVAQFIGDPGMNIITMSNEYKIGFRPRNITFKNEEKLRGEETAVYYNGTILTTENQGSERLYFVDIGIGKVFIKDAGKIRYSIGNEVTLRFTRDSAYFFNSDETRIKDQLKEDELYDFFAKSSS